MILLINPAPPTKSPWCTMEKRPPLGLAHVAAALENGGFEVSILDNYLLEKSIEYVKSLVRKVNPKIVGVTCNSVAYRACIKTVQAIKEVAPNCKVMVGGPHPTYMPHTMTQHAEIDYVVLGEGEHTVPELAAAIVREEGNSTIAKIPGIAYSAGKKTVTTAPRQPISNMDQIPYPARHLVPMHLYDRTIELLGVKPVDMMNTSRGCVFNCAFCEFKRLWGPGYRAFSARRVINEVNHLVTEYGSKGIYFIDDNFTLKKRRTTEICRLIKKDKLDVEWVCETRVDLISRDLLRNMKDAGCRTIWFGIESGSPRILKKMRRDITPLQATQAIRLCKEEGIKTACSFMIGLPGETLGDMRCTLKLAKKLDPEWCQFNIFLALPGGTLYDEILQQGLYDHVEDFVVYVKTKEFDYKLMRRVLQQFQMDYNRSPRRLIRKIRQEGFFPVLNKGLKLIIRRPQSH